jgi:ferredoxin--NADP+ reductase
VSSAALAPVVVEALRALAPGVFGLRFPRTFSFVPGECVPVAADDAMQPRHYSLASGPSDPHAELLFDLVDRGCLTPRLAGLAAGSTILVGAPTGTFRDARGPAVWIAAGTGIAPFLSMVRAGSVANRMLVHGSRTLAGFLYRSELRAALGSAYVPCCSGESGEDVFAGRLTGWLESADLNPAASYLLCGGPAMVVDVRDLLIGRGIPLERILAEIYF